MVIAACLYIAVRGKSTAGAILSLAEPNPIAWTVHVCDKYEHLDYHIVLVVWSKTLNQNLNWNQNPNPIQNLNPKINLSVLFKTIKKFFFVNKVQGVSQLLKQSDWAQIQDFKWYHNDDYINIYWKVKR